MCKLGGIFGAAFLFGKHGSLSLFMREVVDFAENKAKNNTDHMHDPL